MRLLMTKVSVLYLKWKPVLSSVKQCYYCTWVFFFYLYNIVFIYDLSQNKKTGSEKVWIFFLKFSSRI